MNVETTFCASWDGQAIETITFVSVSIFREGIVIIGFPHSPSLCHCQENLIWPFFSNPIIKELYKLEPSPLVRFFMILMALTIVPRPSVKSKSGASCSWYEIGYATLFSMTLTFSF